MVERMNSNQLYNSFHIDSLIDIVPTM